MKRNSTFCMQFVKKTSNAESASSTAPCTSPSSPSFPAPSTSSSSSVAAFSLRCRWPRNSFRFPIHCCCLWFVVVVVVPPTVMLSSGRRLTVGRTADRAPLRQPLNAASAIIITSPSTGVAVPSGAVHRGECSLPDHFSCAAARRRERRPSSSERR